VQRTPPPTRLSIVMPVIDEAAHIDAALAALAPLRAQGVELAVVDGGSRDGTLARCAGAADALLAAPRGRARQMNAGAQAPLAMRCCSCTPTPSCHRTRRRW